MNKSLFLLLLSGSVLVSCNQNNNTQDTTDMAPREDTVMNEVLLTSVSEVLQATSIPDTLSVQMSNNTKDTINTGMYYDIEQLHDKTWMTVLPEQNFQDIGFRVLPSDSKRFGVKLLRDQITYEPGSYRVVKYYMKPDFKETKEQHCIYAEFTVE